MASGAEVIENWDDTSFHLGEVADDEARSAEAGQVLQRWESTFAKQGPDIGCTRNLQHCIPQTDHTPFCSRTTTVPPAMYEEVRQHLVQKKDGSLRFCIDLRCINARTPADAYPVPRIEETLDTLGGHVGSRRST